MQTTTRRNKVSAIVTILSIVCLLYGVTGQAAPVPNDCVTGLVRENIITNQTVLYAEPGNVAAQLGLAQCYLRQEQPVLVEKYLQAVLGVNAANVAALKIYGALYSRQGRWAEARRVYQQRVEFTPTDPVAYSDLYGVLRQLGDDTAAQSAYETYKRLKGLD